METSPQIPTHASQTWARLSFGALPPISPLQCQFSEQTTSSPAGQGKEASVCVQEHVHCGRVITAGRMPTGEDSKKKVWLWVRRGFSRALENVMLSQLFEIPEKHKKEIWASVFTRTDSEAPITLPLDPHNTFYHLIVLYFFLPHYTGGGCL